MTFVHTADMETALRFYEQIMGWNWLLTRKLVASNKQRWVLFGVYKRDGVDIDPGD